MTHFYVYANEPEGPKMASDPFGTLGGAESKAWELSQRDPQGTFDVVPHDEWRTVARFQNGIQVF